MPGESAVSEKRCQHWLRKPSDKPGEGGWKCGSHAFNIGPAQGNLCDEHYWMDRALRGERKDLQWWCYDQLLRKAGPSQTRTPEQESACWAIARIWVTKLQEAEVRELYGNRYG